MARSPILMTILSLALAGSARAETFAASPSPAANAAKPLPAQPAASSTPTRAPAAIAQPTVDEIVQKASALVEHKPKKLACVVSVKAAQLDSDGKPKETQETELTETWTDGVASQGLPYKRSLDGTPFTPEEMRKADEDEKKKREEMKEHEKNGEGGNMESPLTAKQLARHKFELLRRDTVDGRAVYVLSVRPASSAPPDDRVVTREGTIWIDAQTFVPFHAQTHASPLPNHVDKMELDEEFALTPQGELAPRSMLLDVSGGFLFLRRAFHLETRWRDCK